MKHLTFFLSCLMIITLCGTSCNNQNKKTGDAAGTTVTEENGKPVMKEGKGKYGMKSGIVEYKANMMKMDSKMTIYFDGFGAKESTVTEMNMMGMSIKSVSIKKDGIVYTFDPEKKTGQKASVIPEKDIDFENLTEEFQKEMKLEKVGEETFLGKSCVKYTIDSEKFKMKGSYLVWQGVALKSDIDMGGMKVEMTAVKFDENANVPASTFEVPADIKFQ